MCDWADAKGLPYNIGEILQQFTALPLDRIHHYAYCGDYMRALFQDKKLVDVLLHVGVKKFVAHRVVLAAHSVYFARAFILNQKRDHKVTQIRLNKVDPAAFHTILRFLYTGILYINNGNAEHLRKVSKQLQITSVFFRCMDFLGTPTTRLPTHRGPVFDVHAMNQKIHMILSQDFRHFADSTQFLLMDVEALEVALADDQLKVQHEKDVFRGVMRWIAYDVGKRRRHLDRLIKCVRFNTMWPTEIIECTQANEMMRGSVFCRNKVLEAMWLLAIDQHETEDVFQLDCPVPRVHHINTPKWNTNDFNQSTTFVPKIDTLIPADITPTVSSRVSSFWGDDQLPAVLDKKSNTLFPAYPVPRDFRREETATPVAYTRAPAKKNVGGDDSSLSDFTGYSWRSGPPGGTTLLPKLSPPRARPSPSGGTARGSLSQPFSYQRPSSSPQVSSRGKSTRSSNQQNPSPSSWSTPSSAYSKGKRSVGAKGEKKGRQADGSPNDPWFQSIPSSGRSSRSRSPRHSPQTVRQQVSVPSRVNQPQLIQSAPRTVSPIVITERDPVRQSLRPSTTRVEEKLASKSTVSQKNNIPDLIVDSPSPTELDERNMVTNNNGPESKITNSFMQKLKRKLSHVKTFGKGRKSPPLSTSLVTSQTELKNSAAPEDESPPPPMTIEESPPPPMTIEESQPPPMTIEESQPPPMTIEESQPPPMTIEESQPPPMTIEESQPPPMTIEESQPPPSAFEESPPLPMTIDESSQPPSTIEESPSTTIDDSSQPHSIIEESPCMTTDESSQPPSTTEESPPPPKTKEESLLRRSAIEESPPPLSAIEESPPPPSITEESPPPPSITEESPPLPSITEECTPPPSITVESPPPPEAIEEIPPPPITIGDGPAPPIIIEERQPPPEPKAERQPSTTIAEEVEASPINDSTFGTSITPTVRKDTTRGRSITTNTSDVPTFIPMAEEEPVRKRQVTSVTPSSDNAPTGHKAAPRKRFVAPSEPQAAPPPPPPAPPLTPPASAQPPNDTPTFRFYTCDFDTEDLMGRVSGIEVDFSMELMGAGDVAVASEEDEQKSVVKDILVVGGLKDKDHSDGVSLTQRYRPARQAWEKYSKMPEARLNFAVAYLNKQLYVVGGYDPKDAKNGIRATKDMYRFDPSAGSWEQAASLNVARSYHAVCCVDDKIYALGGQDHNDRVLNSCEVYSLSDGHWKLIEPMSCGRVGASCVVCKGHVVVTGGYGEAANDRSPCPVLLTMEWFDPAAGRWERKGQLRVARAQACLVHVRDYLYLCGGVTRDPFTGALCSMRDVDRYDPDKDKWTHVTDLLTARHNAGATVIDLKIYIVGGVSTDTNRILRSVECFDVNSEIWDRTVPDLPRGAKSLSCVVIPSEAL